ncbi:MAG TPA: hypothetical protein VMV79_08890 [Alphaproteobacteria bacterium]|nr:hypothetical protein [Alphaproteobacteria bacterium]
MTKTATAAICEGDDMSNLPPEGAVDPALALAVEDAILSGRFDKLASMLDDPLAGDFPDDLRRDLETLRYFREHYRCAPDFGSLDNKKIALMDSAWAMEVLNKVRAHAASPTE